MQLAPKPLISLSALSRAADVPYQKARRLVAGGFVVADFLENNSTLLFRPDRVAELRAAAFGVSARPHFQKPL